MKSILVRSVTATLLLIALTSCGGGVPKKEVVEASIRKIMPVKFEITGISAVKDIPGLFEVLVKVDKQPVVLYVNSKASLVVTGSVMDVENKKNLTLEAQKKIAVN